MSTLTIRNIEPAIKEKLRLVAASHGRSMEEEVRTILRNCLIQTTPTGGLGSRIHARFETLGGVDLRVDDRTDQARGADFSGLSGK